MEFHPIGYAKGITNSKTVNKAGEYALDGIQNNPDLPDTLAYQIKHLEAELAEKLNSAMDWKFIGIFDLEADVYKDISIPDAAHEVYFILGRKNVSEQIYGGSSAIAPKNQNNRNIIAFGDIYDGDGIKIASKGYVFYSGNTLKVRVREIIGNFPIAIRVYYR